MPDENNVKDFYKSPPDAGIGISEDGRPQYGGMEGVEVVRLPGLPGSRFDSEDVRVQDIPRHVSVRIERAIEDEGFYGAKPHLVLSHLAGALQGADILDGKASARLDQLVGEFALTPEADQKKFFAKEIKPLLASLRPQKR